MPILIIEGVEALPQGFLTIRPLSHNRTSTVRFVEQISGGRDEGIAPAQRFSLSLSIPNILTSGKSTG